LQGNPSANSVNELYSFLSYKSLPNTPEGKVLGYKGVQDNFWSSTGNADTIVLQGETNERHQICNEVGATIEVARRCVDDNKDNHCSFGLHVGSYDYASGWAGTEGKLLLVEFDPQDAVSVPDDCSFQKLRVSKYKVVADISDSRVELDKAVYEANKPIYGSDDDCDYDDDDDEGRDGEDYLNALQFSDDEIAKGLDNMDAVSLSIRNYVENKHELGVNPTLKHIADTKVSRDSGLLCRDIGELCNDLGFDVEENGAKILSDLEVRFPIGGFLK